MQWANSQRSNQIKNLDISCAHRTNRTNYQQNTMKILLHTAKKEKNKVIIMQILPFYYDCHKTKFSGEKVKILNKI